MAETRVELHGTHCLCRGGAWVLLDQVQKSPCPGGNGERRVLGLAEWRQLGKPATLDALKAFEQRTQGGERREFERFEVSTPVRIERIPNWRDASSQGEDTEAEVLASGGALVRTRMAVEKGDILRFRLASYESRAQVMYTSEGSDPGDAVLRLGLKFLDSPLPATFIPPNARTAR